MTKRKCLERRKAKAAKTRAVRLQNKAERAAMAMLLGAEWNGVTRCFEKTVKTVHSNGLSSHWTYRWDRKGNELGAMWRDGSGKPQTM